MNRRSSPWSPGARSRSLREQRVTQFQQLVPFEDHWLVVHHLASPYFRPFGVQQDGGVRPRPPFECLAHADHLSEVLGVIAMGEIEPGDVQTLVDELACVVGRLGFGAA